MKSSSEFLNASCSPYSTDSPKSKKTNSPTSLSRSSSERTDLMNAFRQLRQSGSLPRNHDDPSRQESQSAARLPHGRSPRPRNRATGCGASGCWRDLPRATEKGRKERAAAFLGGLKQLGWIEGRNIRIDIRWAAPGDATAVSLMARMSESNTAGRPGNTINSRGWQKNLLGCRFRCWRRAG